MGLKPITKGRLLDLANNPFGGGDQSNDDESDAPPRFTTLLPQTRDSNAMLGMLQDTLGIGASDGNAFIDEWALQFFKQHGRWPTAADIDDSFFIGATGLVAELPQYFTVGGTTYDNTSGIPRSLGGAAPDDMPASPWQGTYADFPGDIPEFTMEDFQNLLGQYRPGGGGGGGGRRAPVYDKEQIKEQVNEGWRYYLIEEAPNLDQLASRYIAAHSAFAEQGGSLDFSTWLLGEIRQTGRYQTLYGRKPAELSEGDFIDTYRGTARQFGLPTSQETAAIMSGMSSGASGEGFQERVANSRPVMARGGFGRKVANQIAQLGVLNR